MWWCFLALHAAITFVTLQGPLAAIFFRPQLVFVALGATWLLRRGRPWRLWTPIVLLSAVYAAAEGLLVASFFTESFRMTDSMSAVCLFAAMLVPVGIAIVVIAAPRDVQK